MHDDLLDVAARRARAWTLLAALMVGIGPAIGVGILGGPVAGGIAAIVVIVGVGAWLLAGAPGIVKAPWPRAAVRPAELEVANIAAGIGIANGETPATPWQVAHAAPNVAGFVDKAGDALVVTDGAVALLTRDQLEAVAAAQLAIAHEPICRRLDGASSAMRLFRVAGFVEFVPTTLLFSIGLWQAGLAVTTLFGTATAAGWLVGGRVRWWSSVAADAVCVRTTRHPGPLIEALRALARWHGDQIKVSGLTQWTGAGGTQWAIVLGPRWTSQTSVNGRVTDRRSAEMVEDARLLVRAGLVRRVCLGGEEASMTSYEDIAATVRHAGRAAAAGQAAVVEGEFIGIEGVLPRATPAGWHPDPAGRARLRWWDGARWTEHTAA